MNNLSLFLLGLVSINIPACFSQNDECFSKALKPSYPCCKGDKVVFTDKDGDWGVENGKWCGIGNGSSNASDESCFSVALGYKCCESCKVVYTDKDGEWGVEHNKWCGIKDSCTSTVEVVENPAQNTTDVEQIDFEFTFLKFENEKKNILYSPLSIEYALNMLQEGAAGNTYKEINKLIGNTELAKYESIEDNLSFANGLFIRDIYSEFIIANYVNTLKEKYDAEVIVDPFKDAHNANKWIEDKTLGIIKNVLDDKVVQRRDTGMIIINALAIDMEWVRPFLSEDTQGDIFYLDDGSEMEATMMLNEEVRNDCISYYKGSDITAVSMDLKEYKGKQFEFMAIMPKENLSAYVENVTMKQIDEIDKNLKSSYSEPDGVNVRIPKFKFDYELKLKDDLKSLGVNDAFNKKSADFSKMADLVKLQGKVFVSEAIHKADIEFTEKGVKAAAVTVIVMGFPLGMQAPKRPVEVRINKPFMFVIRDKSTKNIWFTGTVYKPNAWADDSSDYSPSNSNGGWN